MVFTSPQYPYQSKSGIQTSLRKRSDYERNFLDAIESGHQIFICNIFSDQYLKNWAKEENQQKTLQKQQINTEKQFDLDQCFIVSDMSFSSSQFQHISPLINLDSFDYFNQNQLFRYIKFVIEYCGYLGIKCIVLPFFKEKLDVITKILNQLQEDLFKAKLGVVLSIKLQNSEGNDDLWQKYIQFTKNIDSKVHIDLILQFTSSLPNKHMINKWMAEKIQFFSFSKSCYVMNHTGNSVLSLPFENLVKQLFKLKSGFIFTIEKQDSQSIEFKSIDYFRYINYLFQIMAKNSSKRQIAARGLYEVLLHPLQPYADNLQSQTYSIFQFDAPKYDEYAVAVLLAFQKIQITNRNIVVYYLGSGRGALIPGIVSASKATKKKVTIYAIQKNPFPLQSLKRRIKQNKWSNIVKIVKSDIKSLNFQELEKPDIFFSELLGGIGDNQLSPECLKWAEEKIKDEKQLQNLICIPQKYSSFIKPVSYPSVHKSLKKHEKQEYFTVNFGWHYSPFKSQRIWEFNHPLPKDHSQAYNRKSLTQFQIPQNITIHGFLGSFDCNLYGNSYFSIVPQTRTIDMYSWFPLYFSFFQEQYLKKGQKIVIEVNRINSQKDKKIWYEWSYAIFSQQNQLMKQSKIHNKNGCQKAIYL